MPRATRGGWWYVILTLLAGCASAPQMAGADDVLRFKREGADDSALLEWVQDPARAFNLTQPDFDRLSKAGINEAVISELRWRTEEYRRSNQPAVVEKHGHADKMSATDEHSHRK